METGSEARQADEGLEEAHPPLRSQVAERGHSGQKVQRGTFGEGRIPTPPNPSTPSIIKQFWIDTLGSAMSHSQTLVSEPANSVLPSRSHNIQ